MTDSPDSTVAPVCPVEALGREIARVNRAFNLIDESSIRGERSERFKNTALLNELDDRHAALEESVTHARAASLAGALLQLAIVKTDADSVFTMVEEDSAWHRKAAECSRRIERCIYSIYAVLEAGSQVPPSEIAVDYYLDPNFDPFPGLQAAIEHAAI